MPARHTPVSMRLAPDTIVLPGPGNSLGGICGQVLVMEGYHGIHLKSDVETHEGLLFSMRR